MRNTFRKPGCYRNAASRRSYYRVLLSLYLLADTEGLFCYATNAELARQAGVAPNTAKSYLHDMELDGTVATFRSSRGAPKRIVVLLDHPEAGSAIKSMLLAGRKPGLHTAEGDGPLARPGIYC